MMNKKMETDELFPLAKQKSLTALYRQHNFLAPAFSDLMAFDSFKDYKESLKKPTLSYEDDTVKDVLNQKSLQYSNPNMQQHIKSPSFSLGVHQFTMSPLKHPREVPRLVERIPHLKKTT